MKNITPILLSALFILSPAGVSLAKGKGEGFPGKGQGAVHSNAPSTGTQMRGKERAVEVGRGKKIGLHREKTTKEFKTHRLEKAHEAREHRQLVK